MRKLSLFAIFTMLVGCGNSELQPVSTVLRATNDQGDVETASSSAPATDPKPTSSPGTTPTTAPTPGASPATPAPSPAPIVTAPTPTPTPTATPTPVPTPTPVVPAPTPTPTPTPVPTTTPVPQPTVTPNPVPTATPVPEPTPTPAPVPTTTPAPAPTLAPILTAAPAPTNASWQGVFYEDPNGILVTNNGCPICPLTIDAGGTYSVHANGAGSPVSVVDAKRHVSVDGNVIDAQLELSIPIANPGDVNTGLCGLVAQHYDLAIQPPATGAFSEILHDTRDMVCQSGHTQTCSCDYAVRGSFTPVP